jgi:hypothetical protein
MYEYLYAYVPRDYLKRAVDGGVHVRNLDDLEGGLQVMRCCIQCTSI